MSKDLTLKPYTYDQLFYTPLFRYKVQNHAVFDAALIMEGDRMRAESEGANKSNKNGWHSAGNIFNEEASCFKTLEQLARQVVVHSTKHITKKYKPSADDIKLFGWMNQNPTGGYNSPHTHPGAHWSGVYYVNQPQRGDKSNSGGKIEFLDPRSDLPFWRKFQSPAFKHKFQIRPQAGEIVLFPSYLLHWVYPNESEQPRVTIAFNATFPD